ncbi:metacaspase-9-like [Gossypium australe]|uniref:Metacaspase-9-like n=1 Tax=Gossypium australe TaxID=47621 RepID=A0A5B6WAH7_9ROSI|nr:metacaspase-9-like [Gossypium australe]
MGKGTKRAVLVGCNYSKTQFGLHGCINDVKTIRDAILNFGFRESDIHVLTDAPGSSVLPTVNIGQKIFGIFGKDVSLKFHPHYVDGLMVLNPLKEDDGILLSGCEANETSYDLVLGNRAFGAFTDAVVNVHNQRMGAGISNKQLMVEAAKILKDNGFNQNPAFIAAIYKRNFLG